MGNIDMASLTKALTYGICASCLFLIGLLMAVELSPIISDAQASLKHKSAMAKERAQSPCAGCHLIYHRAAYIAIGEPKFLAAYPTFKPETPWHTRESLSGKIPEAQWRVYGERWPIPGSAGEHHDQLDVYVFNDGRVLVFTHNARVPKKIAELR